MDAIEFLKQEHQKAKAAFAKVLLSSPHERRRRWNALKTELEVHETIEDACLYGPLSQEGGSKDPGLADCRRYHQEDISRVHGLIMEIDGLGPDDGSWLHKVNDVHSILEHHIAEEEREVFARVGNVWSLSRLAEVGTKMNAMKSEMHRAHDPRWTPHIRP